MATTRTITLPWTHLSAISMSAVFLPAGPWMPTGGVTGARAWGEMRGVVGEFQCQPAIQVANDVRSPGTASGFGTLNANGMLNPAAAAAIADSTTSRFMRAGWLVSLETGSTMGTASVAGMIELQY